MARRFGATWWGRAWIDALENRASLDPNRLPRGRTYARHDRVSDLVLAPGTITATVQGNRWEPYRVVVRVRTYGNAEWERVVATIASRAAHAAALLDGDLEPSILEDAAEAGVDLMPGPGDLQPRCSCPDWADPCKHAAAVCYLVAEELDVDPFALFELRGRPEQELLAELRAHRRTADTSGTIPASGLPVTVTAVDDGQVARDVWRRAATSDHVRRRPMGAAPVPAGPGSPAGWPTDPPPGAPFHAEGLRELAADAAHRAWAQLRGEGDAGLHLDAHADLARRAAATLGTPDGLERLSRRAGTTSRGLTRLAIAWQHGRAAGLAALDEDPWRPPVAAMAEARRAVAEVAPAGTEVTVTANRVTAGPVQIRIDRTGRWWRFHKRGGRWDIASPPAEHPDDLVTGE